MGLHLPLRLALAPPVRQLDWKHIPKSNDTYQLFSRSIANVPIANSSVYNTSFKTGILWDMSAGGSEYSNVTKQPIAWIVKVNGSAVSDAFGDYNYLAQIPYTLANYNTTDGVVSYYLDLG